ncbi:MAG TPA: hypothetical protein VFX51_08720 [Solirubrobacteraceae bacterium]|nr:hypothetical protein [Solirubrobacteraceae bacterium]
MVVVTPAVYDEYAREGLGPPLDVPVRKTPAPLGFRAIRRVLPRALAANLKPQPIRVLAENGGSGVPIFDRSELEIFLSGGEAAPSDQPRIGDWWEFWPTQDGNYAMFPADDRAQRSVATTNWLPTTESAFVDRLDLSLRRVLGGSTSRPSNDKPARPCALLAKEIEPGAPYVGRCSNLNCGGGCSPHVVVQPDDGIYRLMGCDC